jgi:capsular exopolysaccharide synthesis family protein
MAKTYGALKRAEQEQGLKAEIPPIPDASREFESSPSSIEKFPHVELLPALPQKPPLKNLSLLVEEFQRMKHKIIHSDPNLVMKALLFSSPERGEGNSTILIHFAQTLAAEGNRVLLVDGNLRDPSLHKAFRLQQENGLTEMIFSRSPFRNIAHFVKPTSLESLWVITSGNAYPNPASVLESSYLEMLISEVKVHWDWVLLDSPPVTSCSDAVALARKVDGVVLVVQAEKTRWEVVQEVQGRLEHGGGRVLGVVLNKRRYHIPNWIYKSI